MQPAVLPRADVLALSFVRNLPRELLYPVLKGEPVPDDVAGRLPFPEAPPATSLEEFLAQMGCTGIVSLADRARREAENALVRAADKQVSLLVWGDDRYPSSLTPIFDPPLALWIRGDIAALERTTVAVVGSRGASPYGEQAATALGFELASCGVVVASGMARGIDAAAHRGALSAGGDTVAVLGCGTDVVYPPEHGQLAADIVTHGAIVSEYPPGTRPTKWTFPRRNRLISGFSRAVVVVEASERSGALITANCALDQGREVMAVPGNVFSERHRGSHTLIKAGAALVESAADVFALLHLTTDAVPHPSAPAEPLLAALDEADARDLDAIAQRSRSSIAVLLPRLLELELQGLVRRVPGGRFVRSARLRSA